MITVYLWKGAYGHTSLEISDNPKTGEVYISFYPREKGNEIDLILEMTGVSAAPSRNYEEDMQRMGLIHGKGHASSKPKPHDASLVLRHLNEDAILAHWQHFIDQNEKYSFLFNNCSTVVAHCLIAGWLGSLESSKNKEISEKMIRAKLKELQGSVIHSHENTAIDPPSRIGNVNTVAHFANNLVSVSKRFMRPWLGASVRAVSLIAQLVTEYFDKFAWDPHQVHNLVLFLQDEENSKLGLKPHTAEIPVTHSKHVYGRKSFWDDMFVISFWMVVEGIVHHQITKAMDDLRQNQQLNERFRIYLLLSLFFVEHLKIGHREAFILTLELFHTSKTVRQRLSQSIDIQFTSLPLDKLLKSVNAIKLIYHYNPQLKYVDSTLEIYLVEDGQIYRQSFAENLEWSNLPHNVRKALMAKTSDHALMLYPKESTNGI